MVASLNPNTIWNRGQLLKAPKVLSTDKLFFSKEINRFECEFSNFLQFNQKKRKTLNRLDL